MSVTPEQVLAKVYRTAAEFIRRNPATTREELVASLDAEANDLDPLSPGTGQGGD